MLPMQLTFRRNFQAIAVNIYMYMYVYIGKQLRFIVQLYSCTVLTPWWPTNGVNQIIYTNDTHIHVMAAAPDPDLQVGKPAKENQHQRDQGQLIDVPTESERERERERWESTKYESMSGQSVRHKDAAWLRVLPGHQWLGYRNGTERQIECKQQQQQTTN